MRDILLGVQYLIIIGVFIESVIVFGKWKNSLQRYLFLNCIAVLINDIGYLFELRAGSEAEYITALQLSYAGRVWVGFSLFIFVAELTRKKIPYCVKIIMTIAHIGIYTIILTFQHHDLYYKNWHLETGGVFPRFVRENGIMHNLFMTLVSAYIIIGITWLVIAIRKETGKTARRRLVAVLMAVVAEGVFFAIQLVGIPNFTEFYDITMLGYFVGTILMLIAIVSLNLLGTREIAREFMIDRLSEGIIAADRTGEVQYFNEHALKLYPELENDSAAAIGKVRSAIESGSNITVGDRVYSPEENDLIYDGDSYGKIYALVDETEHIKYMEELKRQKDIADNASEAKSRFLANMSHEIRTPINALLGMDEMILRESKEKPIRSYAADIMSAGKTLLSLIGDILDLSKVEEGKMEIIPVEYELASLINDLSNLIAGRAAKKDLEFKIDVNEHIPHILFGDEIRIRQCVLNLLTNAVKYTEKGSVTLKVSYKDKDRDHIMLAFSVADTGIGMRKQDMEALFSPYKRLDERRNRTIEGTGLGMSITRQLLELMKSELHVESEYGKGSVFSFKIEQQVVSREEIGNYSVRFDELKGDEYSYKELFHAPNARILVVDDTEMNVTVMENLLKKTRIRIDTAMSGKEAIRLCATNRYDVLFIDHMMPDMDGIETLGHLRREGENQSTPAVALTANAVSGARQMYLQAGFNDYISKPVDGKKLEKMLKDMISDDLLEEPADDDGSSDSDVEIPQWLYSLPDLDVQTGIENCGDVESFLSVLGVFHNTGVAKAAEIERLHDEGDIEDYTIKVHALKSSARIIGAAGLSKLAEELEKAGKLGDNDFIEKNTDRLLGMYREFEEELSRLSDRQDELKAIDRDTLKDAYQTIKEISQSMDYELMEGMIKELRAYKLSSADEENVANVESALNMLDWDRISDIADKALNTEV